VKKINIKGTIISSNVQWIYDLFGMEATSPVKVSDALDGADGDDVEVIINSGGGDVFAGSEIYTELKSYSGNVTVKIVGIAASAASVIAMAGNKVQISPTAQIMIHNVSSRGAGDYRDFQHEADVLKNYNKSIASAYMIKTGMKEEELLSLMDDETWFNAQQAKENKFVDEILFDESPQFAASFGASTMIPPQVINTIMNMKDKFTPNNSHEEDDSDIFMEKKAKLNLLKLQKEID
jgi:ATP-dependent protease ClpP protease subunit